MSKRDELIAKYATDLKDKCGVNADMDLLTKVTIGCGPSIYNADAATVSGSDQSELDTVKNNFLIKKLGLKDGAELDKGITQNTVHDFENSLNELGIKNEIIIMNIKEFFTYTTF